MACPQYRGVFACRISNGNKSVQSKSVISEVALSEAFHCLIIRCIWNCLLRYLGLKTTGTSGALNAKTAVLNVSCRYVRGRTGGRERAGDGRI